MQLWWQYTEWQAIPSSSWWSSLYISSGHVMTVFIIVISFVIIHIAIDHVIDHLLWLIRLVIHFAWNSKTFTLIFFSIVVIYQLQQIILNWSLCQNNNYSFNTAKVHNENFKIIFKQHVLIYQVGHSRPDHLFVTCICDDRGRWSIYQTVQCFSWRKIHVLNFVTI